ncbi:MAG: thioesterase family protein [Parasporobacterium sp.]|nr:thioesterase family protein [Parasporobacterium sp.]
MLKPGIKNEKTIIVTPELSAAAVGSGLLNVFATPSMIALMEGCAHESIARYLEEGFGSVGISLDIRHVAATPVGMKVRCESELTEADGKMLTFEVKAYDEAGLIGEGIHRRCIVNNEKFQTRTDAKMKK